MRFIVICILLFLAEVSGIWDFIAPIMVANDWMNWIFGIIIGTCIVLDVLDA